MQTEAYSYCCQTVDDAGRGRSLSAHLFFSSPIGTPHSASAPPAERQRGSDRLFSSDLRSEVRRSSGCDESDDEDRDGDEASMVIDMRGTAADADLAGAGDAGLAL